MSPAPSGGRVAAAVKTTIHKGNGMQTKTNFAGRMGRWSAHHRKTAIVGWVLFVVLAFMAGGAVGTNELSVQEAGVGDSGKASNLVHDSFAKAVSESVLISDTRLDADSGQFHAAVDDAVARLKRTSGVDHIESPYGAPAACRRTAGP